MKDRIGEVRRDEYGPIRCIAQAEGYVMVRRTGCVPFALPVYKWETLRMSLAHEVEPEPEP